jgi:hypothetical protein
LGGAAAIGSGITGGVAYANAGQARTLAQGAPAGQAAALQTTAYGQAQISTGLLVGAVVSAGIGLVLFFTSSPRESAPRAN